MSELHREEPSESNFNTGLYKLLRKVDREVTTFETVVKIIRHLRVAYTSGMITLRYRKQSNDDQT